MEIKRVLGLQERIDRFIHAIYETPRDLEGYFRENSKSGYPRLLARGFYGQIIWYRFINLFDRPFLGFDLKMVDAGCIALIASRKWDTVVRTVHLSTHLAAG